MSKKLYKSGAEKRKLSLKKSEERAKLPKIEHFFSKLKSDDQISTPSSISLSESDNDSSKPKPRTSATATVSSSDVQMQLQLDPLQLDVLEQTTTEKHLDRDQDPVDFEAVDQDQSTLSSNDDDDANVISGGR